MALPHLTRNALVKLPKGILTDGCRSRAPRQLDAAVPLVHGIPVSSRSAPHQPALNNLILTPHLNNLILTSHLNPFTSCPTSILPSPSPSPSPSLEVFASASGTPRAIHTLGARQHWWHERASWSPVVAPSATGAPRGRQVSGSKQQWWHIFASWGPGVGSTGASGASGALWGPGSTAASLALAAAATLLTFSTASCHVSERVQDENEREECESEAVTNWSATHRVIARVVHRPETLEELTSLVAEAHRTGQRIRPVGSGISPNGLGLCEDGMVNLGLMDQVLSIDQSSGLVVVQAGARVEQVVEALRPYGLTLQNYASVREQQIGGFIQVGAHGTGAAIPPVDEQVVGLTLVTPGKGLLHLTPQTNPDLFYFSRCALGALGVVAEVTLQTVPAYLLLEETFVSDAKTIKSHHRDWLKKYKHIRYMWIPNTSAVVVVRSNPLPPASSTSATPISHPKKTPPVADRPSGHTNSAPQRLDEMEKRSLSALHRLLYELTPFLSSKESKERAATAAMAEPRSLYHSAFASLKGLPIAPPQHISGNEADPDLTPDEGTPDAKASVWSGSGVAGAPKEHLTEEQLDSLSFTELRDELLALQPQDARHVARVNKAEAEFWRKSQGFRVAWSDQILGFDCGGQQWVSEVCFPVPSQHPFTLNSQAPTRPGDAPPQRHSPPPSSPSSSPPSSSPPSPSSPSSSPPSSSPPALVDIDYVESILRLIETQGIPAPAPIEQRWTCGSRSPMSPASILHPSSSVIDHTSPILDPTSSVIDPTGGIQDASYSWVGIIMYLPSTDPAQRAAITERFMQYKMETARELWDKYDAHEHWAKIEIPSDGAELKWLKERLHRRFPSAEFAKLRKELDPKNILSNSLLDSLMP